MRKTSKKSFFSKIIYLVIGLVLGFVGSEMISPETKAKIPFLGKLIKPKKN